MSDVVLPPFPVDPTLGKWAFWGLTALATALIYKLPVKLLGTLLGKVKDFGKAEKQHISRGDFLVSIAEIKETVHRGQQSTETLIKMVNDNVNVTRSDVSNMGKRVDKIMLTLATGGGSDGSGEGV